MVSSKVKESPEDFVREWVFDVDERLLSQLREWLVEVDVREVDIEGGVETTGKGIARVVEHLDDVIICEIRGGNGGRGWERKKTYIIERGRS